MSIIGATAFIKGSNAPKIARPIHAKSATILDILSLNCVPIALENLARDCTALLISFINAVIAFLTSINVKVRITLFQKFDRFFNFSCMLPVKRLIALVIELNFSMYSFAVSLRGNVKYLKACIPAFATLFNEPANDWAPFANASILVRTSLSPLPTNSFPDISSAD